jgi:pentatricopeptide repeat protein
MLRPMHEQLLRIENDRAAALDILLVLADAEARWNDYERALDLLNEAEDAGCVLTPEYELKRHTWDAALAA